MLSRNSLIYAIVSLLRSLLNLPCSLHILSSLEMVPTKSPSSEASVLLNFGDASRMSRAPAREQRRFKIGVPARER